MSIFNRRVILMSTHNLTAETSKLSDKEILTYSFADPCSWFLTVSHGFSRFQDVLLGF